MNIYKIIFSFSFGVILCTACSPTVSKLADLSEDEIRSTYTLFSNIAYGTDSLQTMDIHKSGIANTLKNKNFTIVYIHGGGFYLSDKLESHEMAFVKPFLKKGMNVVNMNYTLKQGVLITIEDVNMALNFLAAHNDKYKLNLDKVILVGFSAGGSIAATLGLSQNNLENPFPINPKIKIKGIVDFSGPVDGFDTVENIFTNWELDYKDIYQQIGKAMFPSNDDQNKEVIHKKVAAITYFDSNDPGFFLWSGGQDNQVPASTFTKFIPLIESNQSKNKVIQVETGQHYPSQEQMKLAYYDIFEFLDKK
jgi:acetyl esterase/lipase